MKRESNPPPPERVKRPPPPPGPPLKSGQVLTCVYCGHQYPDGTPAAKHALLNEHIKVCKEHPLREAEHTIAKLQAALEGFIGTRDPEELDAMEAIMRTSVAPASDKAAAIDAIDALRYCANRGVK